MIYMTPRGLPRRPCKRGCGVPDMTGRSLRASNRRTAIPAPSASPYRPGQPPVHRPAAAPTLAPSSESTQPKWSATAGHGKSQQATASRPSRCLRRTGRSPPGSGCPARPFATARSRSAGGVTRRVRKSENGWRMADDGWRMAGDGLRFELRLRSACARRVTYACMATHLHGSLTLPRR